MAWTQVDLDALDKALAMGARVVDHPTNGKVEYRSLNEMIKLREMISQSLRGVTDTLADNRVVSGMNCGFTRSYSLCSNGRLVR
ncbi:hypothetical protein FB480_103447 [Agrobacterium vitis]|nr:hypothetical protein FB480_103447 [Agrobacterium vitis]